MPHIALIWSEPGRLSQRAPLYSWSKGSKGEDVRLSHSLSVCLLLCRKASENTRQPIMKTNSEHGLWKIRISTVKACEYLISGLVSMDG